MFSKSIFTARKHKLWEGNVFTGVCLSTKEGGGQYAWLRGMHDWEGCVCGWGWGHVWSGREHVWLGTGRVVCMAGDGAHVWLGRGVHSWGLEGGMCLAGEGVYGWGGGTPVRLASWRYASYWNTVLFILMFFFQLNIASFWHCTSLCWFL